MKKTICDLCKQELPLGQSISYQGKDFCESCIKILSEKSTISKDEISWNVDQSVCLSCGYDNGSIDLPLDGGMPICDNCRQMMLNRPFPGWVKAFCLAIVIIVILGMSFNAKFFRAHFALRDAMGKFSEGDMEHAAAFSREAAGLLPENNDVQAIYSLCEGYRLVQLDSLTEALPHLENSAKFFPEDKYLQYYILITKAGIAFESHNYPQMYQISKELDSLHSDIPTAVLYRSSAAACMYVVTKDKKYYLESEERIHFARKISQDKDGGENESYIKRIRYRLDSKEILTTQEYEKRFPAKKGGK